MREKVAIGCYWNNHFVGVLCYAPCAISCCSSFDARYLLFASSRSILFNVSKTQLVCFSHTCMFFICFPARFSFNVSELNLSHSAKYLGHNILSFNLSDTDDNILLFEWRKILFAKLNACSTHSLPATHLLKLSY